MINAYSIWKKVLPFFLNAIFVLPFLILTLLMGLHYLQATAIVGLISNLLLIFVILGRVKFRKSTENIYVLAKTIFDSLYLIGYNAEFFEIRATAFPICVLQDLLFLFALQASVFAIIAMLVERFLVIMCPEEYENCSNKKRMLRWKIFCLLILGIGCCQIFLGITSYARNDQQQEMQIGLDNSTFFPKCTRIQNGFRRISSFASYTGTFFLPLILFILVNSLIGFKVRYSMATVKFFDKRSIRRNRESSQSASSALTKKYFPMHSAIPFVFPLVFVLLNTSTYAMNFAYPPARVQEYSENVAIMEMKDAADLANLCSFSVNFPLFILIKVALS